MADSSSSSRRALLTEREGNVIAGEADDVSDEARWQLVSRIRNNRLGEQLPKDIEALAAHGDLLDDFLDEVDDALDAMESDTELDIESEST